MQDEDIDSRIEKLKQRVADLTGPFFAGTAENCPGEAEEQFWKNILAIESAPQVEPFALLVDSGIALPAPEELDDAALTQKLWEIIRALALLGMHLDHTDHLSDRELYARLWHDELRQPEDLLPPELNAVCYIDLVEGGAEEGPTLYMRYYADESERRGWMKDFPDFTMPAHEEPPFDRDRLLP